MLWLTVVVAVALLGILTAISIAIWPRVDGRLKWPVDNPIIMFVPIAILEWAFAGGMVSVLLRLASRRDLPASRLGLYTWAIAKPIIGLFMGSLVYFLALAAGKLLDTTPPPIQAREPAAVATPAVVATPVAPAVAEPVDQKPEERSADPVLWLNVVAFVGGFSDELSVGLILRFVRRRLGDEVAEEGGGERRKPAADRGG